MSDVTTAVHSVLTEKFEVVPADIAPAATLESLDLDSLSLAELALALQEQLGVKVEEHEAAKGTTVGELVAAIEAKLALAGAE
ncbi:phosphopantetheine-binding protein [Streptomyces sp. NBC_01465]|uniref:phosphopantetheine-binding protein n=1 Tax=Streptomyces sp. NBC_01465 TaxID=2903878 RepID=UPI002E303A74|nr:phosphopantetheine-binding protein [Streptomyces sp. NBC_01465]